jgi:hypothetical protein
MLKLPYHGKHTSPQNALNHAKFVDQKQKAVVQRQHHHLVKIQKEKNGVAKVASK